MLEVKNIKYAYNADYQALKGVSLKVERGEMVALLGKNGAGKSTLFLHLNGIYEPDEGQVFIDGEELKYDKKSLLKFRQKVGIVFQNPDDQIFAPTVEEDVAFGPLNLGLPMEEVQDRVEEALARVGMSGFEKTAPHHLSGGQKKRVAIAGILAMKPEVMVLDEPTAGLDPIVRNEILDIFREFVLEEDHSIFISSHITGDLEKIADEVVFIDGGKLFLQGNKDEILERHGILKCRKDEIDSISKSLIVGVQEGAFGVDVLINDMKAAAKLYPELVIDRANLEQIMLFYVASSRR